SRDVPRIRVLSGRPLVAPERAGAPADGPSAGRPSRAYSDPNAPSGWQRSGRPAQTAAHVLPKRGAGYTARNVGPVDGRGGTEPSASLRPSDLSCSSDSGLHATDGSLSASAGPP